MAEDQNEILQTRVEIRTIGRAAGMTAEAIDDMIDRDLSVIEARAAAFDAMQARPRPSIRITRSHDDPAALLTRATDALAFRAGVINDLPEASREFAHMSLLDHARAALDRAGISHRGMSADEIFRRSGTSDFPLLVSNVANKTVAQSYQAAQSTLKPLFRQRTLPDFKEATSIRLGEMDNLVEITEFGEIRATGRAEQGEKLQLKTFARGFNVSRKLLINDDLSLLSDITSALGAAAASTEADALAALLTGSDLLSDGLPLFDVSRDNTVPGGLSVATLTAARLKLRQTTGISGSVLINATPKYLVVGPELETTAEQLLSSIYATTVAEANPFSQKLQLIVEPRLTGTDWYLAADPAQAAVFQIGYLASAPGPQVERADIFEMLGSVWRVYFDFGTGFLGHRGIVRGV